MKRIRVDTDQLHSTAEDFENAAADIIRAGDEALSVAMSLPEYGGRLSGPARNAGYEIQRRCREMGGGCRDAAAALDSAARAYEAVDAHSVNAIWQVQSTLSAATAADGFRAGPAASVEGGNEGFGYTYLSQDYVVIWCHGYYMRVNLSVPPLSSEDYRKAMKLIGHIDAFDRLLQSIPEKYRTLVEDACWTIAGLLVSATPIVGIVAFIGALVKLVAEIKDCVDILETFQKLIQEAGDIAKLFSELYNTEDPGIDGRVEPSAA